MKMLIVVLVGLAIAVEVLMYEANRIGYDRGYDKGLEDGIRMANEVVSEVEVDE